MRESFYEESSSPNYSKFSNILVKLPSVLFWIILVFTIIYFRIFFDLSNPIFYVFLVFLILFMLYLKFVDGRINASYDYTFISGTIRFNKIIRNKKRKHVCHFEHTDVIKVGKMDSDSYHDILSSYKGKIVYLCANKNDDKDYFYIYANGLDKKTLYVLECTDEFIKYIVSYAGNNVLEKEYKQ